MCDTLIAGKSETLFGLGLFAKNSDRPPNEAQYLDWLEEQSHSPGEMLRTTYLKIPQVEHTNSLLLSRPHWMWGGEMGVNQHGLAIGNEAVFSRIPAIKEPALLGMDLLRLALERAATAPRAVDVITSLLEEFGQGGNCVEDGNLYYHNSYLISDPAESWVLETIDRHWAARRIDPLYSISNLLSLETKWDLASDGFEDLIIQKGYLKRDQQINITKNLSDLIYTTFADGKNRCQRSGQLMRANQGKISVQSMAEILRDHGGKSDPTPGIMGADICMHASLGPIRGSQSTASMIAELKNGNPLIFTTGTSAPCTGIFKPVWVDAPINKNITPGSVHDNESIFWTHETLHRETIKNFAPRLETYKDQRDALEEEFIQGGLKLKDASKDERVAYSEFCFQKAEEAEKEWLKKVLDVPEKKSFLHSLAWSGFNKRAGLI